MPKLESAVIVFNDYGSVTSVRFDNPEYDRLISGTGKAAPYAQIEKYINGVINV